MSLCPAHHDVNPSLSITVKDNRILLKCHAGCETKDILAAMGLTIKDLFLDKSESHRRVVAVYPYHNGKGKVIFEVVKFEPKGFAQRRPVAGGYEWNLKGVKRVLYHLPEVLEAVANGRSIYITEGEQDSDSLRGVGIAATTNPGGAGKWRDSYSKTLTGAHVVLIADKDKAGRRHAQQVANALSGIAASLKVMELPDRNGHAVKDSSDWLAAGGTPEGLQRLVDSTSPYSPSQEVVGSETKHLGLTDTANAEYMVSVHSDSIRYDHKLGRWLLWRSHRWHEDPGDSVYRLAIASVRKRYSEASTIDDLNQREKVARWCISSEQRSRLESAIALARMLKPIADDGQEWDADPWLLGVHNGIVDLRTGRLRPGKPEDRITMSCRPEYHSDAKASRWLQFLDEVFSGDSELVDWLQRALGYAITGDISEQLVFLLTGRGANGKSVLLSALRYTLGDYAYDAPFSTFDLYRRGDIPNDVAALHRRRFVTSSETSETARLNEARIKALTGGDTITARFLHREFFTFEPALKLFLATNYLPRVTDLSFGFWRRVRVIPFKRQFVEDADKHLGEKLRQEAEGILAWLVNGCLRWQEQGLEPVPAAVENAVSEYYTESDPLSEFLSAYCVIRPDATVKSQDLYKAYKQWTNELELKKNEVLTQNAFGRRLGNRFERKHTEVGAIYQGVGLASGADGFLTDFEPTDKNQEVFSQMNPRVRKNGKIPPESVSTHENETNPSATFLPDGRRLDWQWCLSTWSKVGKPIVHVGDKDNIFDLSMILYPKKLSSERLQRIVSWLEEHSDEKMPRLKEVQDDGDTD